MKLAIPRMLISVCLIFASFSVHALTQTQTIDDLTFTVYAPDWIWQKSAVNILITMENTGIVNQNIHLAVTPPESLADHFAMESSITDGLTLVVPAGGSLRHAFTNIIALGDVERQTYNFSINATVDGQSINVAYPLTTIRGPVVNTAKWAMMLPAIICAAWCIVFVVALRRFAKPGAWKSPSTLDLSDSKTDKST